MYTYFVFTVFYYLFGRTERLPTQGGRERVLSPEQETEIMNMVLENNTITLNQIKSNQITFIVTSPQHKCLGEWNSYERAPDSAEKQQTIYIWADSAKKQQQFTYGQTVQKNNNSNLHMDRQCKKTTTAIYIWTVHIYRLYRRQCAKYTYIYSVHIVYYKDILNYQLHIIHRMGTSTLCTVSIHNVVYA